MTLPRPLENHNHLLGVTYRHICLIFLFLTLSSTVTISQSAHDPLFAAREPAENFSAVKKIISADTFYLANDTKVQLIGLKALPPPKPEKKERDQYGFIVKKEQLAQSIDEEALDFVIALLEGKEIRLEFDSQKRGSDQILFAYVYLKDSGLFVNEEILRMGYASLSLMPPNLKHSDRLRAAYQEARQEQRGIHNE